MLLLLPLGHISNTGSRSRPPRNAATGLRSYGDVLVALEIQSPKGAAAKGGGVPPKASGAPVGNMP